MILLALYVIKQISIILVLLTIPTLAVIAIINERRDDIKTRKQIAELVKIEKEAPWIVMSARGWLK